MQENAYLTNYYQSHDEDGRLDSRRGTVEFTTTMRYIEKYLQPGMRILEVGAGTGRYSHTLAQKGYRVDAVELIAHNIEIFKQHTVTDEPVTITQGNATDLSAFADNTYDITLLLGPMYHLIAKEDRISALSEAIRVTKKGGVILVAYCMSDPSILEHAFLRGGAKNLIASGMLDTETFTASSNPWDIFQLHRKADIEALRADFPITPLHFVATDGYARHMKETLAQMDEETFEIYLRYHLATCEQQDLVGYSHHTLDIFRKEG